MAGNIFKKVVEMGHLALDNYITELKKARSGDAMDLPFNMQMRQSYANDPDKQRSQYAYKQKLTLIPDETKRLMSLRDPVIAAIHQVRVQQCSIFSRPQPNKYSPGFVIRRKDSGKEELSQEEQKQDEELIKEVTNFILNCGVIDEERKAAHELMDFETFMKLIIRDGLTVDTAAIERIPDKKGRLHHFLPASALTIRFASAGLDPSILDNFQEDYNDNFQRDKLEAGQYRFVQVINGRIRKAFTDEEMILRFRNPVTDLFTNGYSIGELDLLISIITSHLYAEKYNQSIFTHGFNTRGMLNLKGEIEEDQLQALRRSWFAQGVGYDAMFRTPIINAPEGVEWVPLQTSNRDMEFSQYMDYLIKLICAIYLMAPEEINFSSARGASDVSGGSVNYSNAEKKVLMSQDRGLRPLLRWIENIVNEDILPAINDELKDKYEFVFVGLDSETRADELERQVKESHVFKTVNEVRAEQNLDPIEGCDIILDSVFLQWYTQFSEVAQQKQAETSENEGEQEGSSSTGELTYAPPDEQPSDDKSSELTYQSPDESSELTYQSLDEFSDNESSTKLDTTALKNEIDKVGQKSKKKVEKSILRKSSAPQLIRVEVYKKSK